MRRALFCFFSAIFILSYAAASDLCFYPAVFLPVTDLLELPCVYLYGLSDECYFVYLKPEIVENDVWGLGIVSVNATGITTDQFSNNSSLPYYDPDNETLVIPALVYMGKTYSLKLKLARGFSPGSLIFLFDSVIPVNPALLDPICIPYEIMNSSSFSSPRVFSYRVKQRGELTLCYEFEGPPDFVSIAAQVPPIMPIGDIEVEGVYAPCPLGYIVGCYTYDEDNNWYAMYKYKELDSPLGYMVLFCPEDKGYKLFFP